MIKKMLLIIIPALICSLQSSGQIGEEAPRHRDSAWEEMRHEERKPIEYAYVREADVLWSKRVWQVIDLREKINQPLYFPPTPTGNMRSLMKVLWDGVMDGTLTAYDVDAEDFNPDMKLDTIALKNRLLRTMTITMQRPTPPYQEYDTTLTLGFNTEDVLRFRIKEDWFFDAKRSVLEVRILGICPVREAIDPVTGESRGDEPLFWVYFPEARNILVNAPVFNRQNDAMRMSYDDLFVRRFFSSTIYKASNVHDKRIGEFYQGLDALLEAQRIKEQIRNFEHDLWEF